METLGAIFLFQHSHSFSANSGPFNCVTFISQHFQRLCGERTLYLSAWCVRWILLSLEHTVCATFDPWRKQSGGRAKHTACLHYADRINNSAFISDVSQALQSRHGSDQDSSYLGMQADVGAVRLT